MIELNFAPPPTKEDRYLLVDADPIAYFAAFNMDDSPEEAVFRRTEERIVQIFEQCQVQKGDRQRSALWLTGAYNFRNDICTLKQYKGDRYDANGVRVKPQPKWLHSAKEYMVKHHGACTSDNCEADDMLSMSVPVALSRPGVNEVVISSVDKDLKINYCTHHNQTTGAFVKSSAPGELHLDSKGKPRGTGELFFYFQMLCGDTTDWIPGLPYLEPESADKLYRKGIHVRPGKCGPMTAYKILASAKSTADAERRVWMCYRDHWERKGYKHWRDGRAYPAGLTTAQNMFLEQGRLLWMQQTPGEMWTPKHIPIGG